MRKAVYPLFVVSGYLISGCSHLPEMPEEILDTATVIQHIKCEFSQAAKSDPRLSYLKKWNTKFTLTLETDEKGSLSVGGEVVSPLFPAILAVPFGTSVSRQVVRSEAIIFEEAVTATVADAHAMRCPQQDRFKTLGGSLGFADLFVRAKASIDRASIEPTQLNYTLSFVISRTGTTSPRWTLIPIGKSLLEAGFNLNGNREHTHTLAITLQPKPELNCKLFPEFFHKYKKCPEIVATIDDVVGSGTKNPGVPTKKGVSPESSWSLKAGDQLNTLRNLQQDLRRLQRVQ